RASGLRRASARPLNRRPRGSRMPRKSAPLKSVLKLAGLTALTFVLFGGAANAAVPDAPWSGTGTKDYTITSNGVANDAPEFTYNVAGKAGSWTFQATSKSARAQPIKYTYTGYHAFYSVFVKLEAYVIRDGREVATKPLVNAGPAYCCTAPSGGFTYT